MVLWLTKDNAYSNKANTLALVQKPLGALRFTTIRSNSMVRLSVRMSRRIMNVSKCRKANRQP